MGIVKKCIIILLIIYTIYSVDVFLDWIYNVEKEDIRIIYYTLKELNFCKNGNLIITDDTILCEQKFIDLKYHCDDLTCSYIQIYKNATNNIR